MPHDSSRTTPRPATRPARPAPTPAPHDDQIDALVGMLMEHAQLMHELMGGEPRTFDFDKTKARLYRIARARNAAVSRRYRDIARRGFRAAPADAQPVDRAGDRGARRTRHSEPQAQLTACAADQPPY